MKSRLVYLLCTVLMAGMSCCFAAACNKGPAGTRPENDSRIMMPAHSYTLKGSMIMRYQKCMSMRQNEHKG